MIAHALGAGAARVVPVEGIDEARALKAAHPDWLLVGERHGRRLPGFDCGNSPTEVLAVPDLAGRTLVVAGHELRLGPPQARELLPHGTLYAHFVDAGEADEAGFLEAMGAELAQLEVRCQRICGRERHVRGPLRTLHGYSLMLHGLREAAALRVLEHGLGAHRLLGCGVFVPHKSAAAVGEIE